jgi:hypothetical protein
MGKYLNFIKQPQILLEIKSTTLLNNTDKGRLDRADVVFTRQPTITTLDDGLEMMKYNFKGNPSVENKRQWGYIKYNPKTKDIKKLYCSCLDFAFHSYRLLQSKGLVEDDNKIPEKYTNHAAVIPEDRLPKVTNPKHKKYVCKHLAALLKFYYDPEK